MPYEITNDEYVEIDGVPLATTAWESEDLSDLYGTPELRGDDRVIPGKEGVLAKKRVPHSKHCVIPMFVNGEKDPEGTPYTDVRMGMLANIDLLHEVVLPDPSSATKSLIWHLPDGSTRSGEIVMTGPLAPQQVDTGTTLCVIEFVIPSGFLSGDPDPGSA